MVLWEELFQQKQTAHTRGKRHKWSSRTHSTQNTNERFWTHVSLCELPFSVLRRVEGRECTPGYSSVSGRATIYPQVFIAETCPGQKQSWPALFHPATKYVRFFCFTSKSQKHQARRKKELLIKQIRIFVSFVCSMQRQVQVLQSGANAEAV